MREALEAEAEIMYERLLELLSEDDTEEKSDEIYKPFADYEDMDECIEANSDKDDPGAYCAQIHYNATGEWPGEKSVHKGSIFRREWHQRKEIQNQARAMDNECSRKINDAIKEQVWPEELEKSPTWQDDDDVTQQTREWVESVFKLRDPLYNEYADVPETAGLRVTEVIKDALTQPQGWSLDSIVDELDKEFSFLPHHRVEKIVRQEVAAVLNEAELVSLQARPEEPTVKWVGPDDQSTTDLCTEVKEEVGDGVPVSELLDILEEKARKYESGTPQRADQGIPHWLCRHTIQEV